MPSGCYITLSILHKYTIYISSTTQVSTPIIFNLVSDRKFNEHAINEYLSNTHEITLVSDNYQFAYFISVTVPPVRITKHNSLYASLITHLNMG